MASICTSVQVPVQHFQFKTLDGFDFYTQRFTPTLADITVTHPAPSCFPLSSSSQMYTPLYFAKKAEARKNSRYLATPRAMSHLFHPYAVETFGSCGAVLENAC